MLRIKSATFGERYPGEHTELRDEYARDNYEQNQVDRYNNYYIRETFIDPNTGQEIERMSEDGYVSAEEAANIARSDLQDSIQEGAVEVDIVHKTEGWLQTVWSRDAEPTSQPMTAPLSR